MRSMNRISNMAFASRDRVADLSAALIMARRAPFREYRTEGFRGSRVSGLEESFEGGAA